MYPNQYPQKHLQDSNANRFSNINSANNHRLASNNSISNRQHYSSNHQNDSFNNQHHHSLNNNQQLHHQNYYHSDRRLPFHQQQHQHQQHQQHQQQHQQQQQHHQQQQNQQQQQHQQQHQPQQQQQDDQHYYKPPQLQQPLKTQANQQQSIHTSLTDLTYSFSDDTKNWKFRKVRAILNKITPETFDKLSKDILSLGLNSPQVLRGIIHFIFEKAIRDSKFCALYAKLCHVLCKEAPNYESQPPNTFCKILISKCEAEFDRRRQASQEFDGKTDLTDEEFELKAVAKQNMLANIRFICELRKNDFIDESIIHECIRELLQQKRKPILDLSEDLECICQIMKTIGCLLDVKASKNLMNQYFDRMEFFAKKQELPPRIRFMLRDVIDLRYRNWLPRPYQKEETNPQMVSKIREESMTQPSSGSALTTALEKMCSTRNLIGKSELRAKIHGKLSLLLDDDEPGYTTSADHFGPGTALLPIDDPLSAFSSHKPVIRSSTVGHSLSNSSSPAQHNKYQSTLVQKNTSNSHIRNSYSSSNVEAMNPRKEVSTRQSEMIFNDNAGSLDESRRSHSFQKDLRQPGFDDRQRNFNVQPDRRPFIKRPENGGQRLEHDIRDTFHRPKRLERDINNGNQYTRETTGDVVDTRDSTKQAKPGPSIQTIKHKIPRPQIEKGVRGGADKLDWRKPNEEQDNSAITDQRYNNNKQVRPNNKNNYQQTNTNSFHDNSDRQQSYQQQGSQQSNQQQASHQQQIHHQPPIKSHHIMNTPQQPTPNLQANHQPNHVYNNQHLNQHLNQPLLESHQQHNLKGKHLNSHHVPKRETFIEQIEDGVATRQDIDGNSIRRAEINDNYNSIPKKFYGQDPRNRFENHHQNPKFNKFNQVHPDSYQSGFGPYKSNFQRNNQNNNLQPQGFDYRNNNRIDGMKIHRDRNESREYPNRTRDYYGSNRDGTYHRENFEGSPRVFKEDSKNLSNSSNQPTKLSPPPTFFSSITTDTKNVSLRPSYNLNRNINSSSQPTTPTRGQKMPQENTSVKLNSGISQGQKSGTDVDKPSQNQNETKNDDTKLTDSPQSNTPSNKDKQKAAILTKFGNLTNEQLTTTNTDIPLLVTKIKELKVSKSIQADCLLIAFKQVLQKSDQDRENMSKLLTNLIPGIFESESLLKAYKNLFNQLQALEIEIPKVKSHLALLLSQSVANDLISLAEVGATLVGGRHHPLFLLFMQKLEKKLGQAVVGEKFTASKIDLLSMLTEADRCQERLANILRDRNLGFLCPMLTIEPDLWSQITEKDASSTAVTQWIQDNVGQTLLASPTFARVFTTCLLRYIMLMGGIETEVDSQENKENETENQSPLKSTNQVSGLGDIVKEYLTKYQSLFQTVLKDESLQLAAIYASQNYFHKLEFPKGALLRWFHLLFELSIVDGGVFLKWKEEINDEVPGKRQALFQVNNWLNWLEDSDDEDSDVIEA